MLRRRTERKAPSIRGFLRSDAAVMCSIGSKIGRGRVAGGWRIGFWRGAGLMIVRSRCHAWFGALVLKPTFGVGG